MALLGGAGAAYVEYSTYENDDCVNVVTTSVYAGVPSEYRTGRWNRAEGMCPQLQRKTDSARDTAYTTYTHLLRRVETERSTRGETLPLCLSLYLV